MKCFQDGVANPADAALRDFAGSCIKEFVKWTIKQADREDLLKNPINIKLWVRTISSFSVHSDPFKRLGAALIFNNIYTILREESHMFNMFWLEILYAFVNNLALAQTNNIDDSNGIDQVIQALNHVQRGLVEKPGVFNKKDNIRRKPPNFEGNTLKDVAVWLLHKTGSINPYCRQRCMDMFCKIAPLVASSKNSIVKFRELHIDKDPEMIINIYEDELLKCSTLNSVNNLKGITRLFNWMQSLLCALDGYIFITANHLIPAKLTPEKSTFFTSLQFFLQFVQLQGITETLNLMPDIENTVIYTTTEKEHFNNLKSNIVNKIIEFAVVILQNEVDITCITKMPDLFWNNHLWDLLCHRIFDPSVLGYDITSLENEDAFLNLLEQINNQCSQETVDSLINSLSTYLINKVTNNSDITINIISLKQRQLLKGMLLLQQSVFSDKLNIVKYTADTIKILLSGLAESNQNEKSLVKLHRNAQLYWDLRLQISLKNTLEFCEMIEFICNQTKVYNQEQNEYLEYGRYFFQTFKDTLIKCAVTDYTLFCDRIFKSSLTNNILGSINEILRYIHHNFKTIEHAVLQNVVHTSLNYWNRIMTYLDENITELMLGIEFIDRLITISVEPFYKLTQSVPSLRNWIVNLLTYEDSQWTLETNLNFKSEILRVLSHVVGPHNDCEVELK